MIKAIYVSIYIPLVFLLAQTSTDAVYLQVDQWVAFALWVVLMTVVATVGSLAFKSVWLRDGFAGLNKILEDHEAIKFLAAVTSFIFLEMLIALKATEFSGKYKHEAYQYYLFFSGCVGTGGYALVSKVMGHKDVKDHVENTINDHKAK